MECVGTNGDETVGRMSISSSQRKTAFAQQARQELESLASRGVWMTGNGFSSVVLVKGELGEAERSGGELLSGADGVALRSALGARGYAPEDFCGLACIASPGAGGAAFEGQISVELFREALEALDPELVILLDVAAIELMREAYADALAAIEDFDTAMLTPGLIAPVLGRRVLALDGFEAALRDRAEKQRMWSYLKKIAPAGAPY